VAVAMRVLAGADMIHTFDYWFTGETIS